MAALTYTSAQVRLNLPSVSGLLTSNVAEVALNAGEMVKLTGSSSTKWEKAGAASDLTSITFGLCLSTVSADQQVIVATGTQVAVDIVANWGGASANVGEFYYLGSTVGEIIPFADITATHFSHLVGQLISSSILRVQVNATGVAV